MFTDLYHREIYIRLKVGEVILSYGLVHQFIFAEEISISIRVFIIQP